MFRQTANFLKYLLVCILWKRADFHLLTKTISFSGKFTDWILNRFLVPSATEDKINLFNKIIIVFVLSMYIVSKRNRETII